MAAMFTIDVSITTVSKMDYVSSSGLRVVLSTHKQFAGVGGKFIVRNLNKEVRSVFELTGFNRLLNIE